MRRISVAVFSIVLSACAGLDTIDAPPATAPATPPAVAQKGVILYDVSDLVDAVRSGIVTVTQSRATLDMFLRQELSESGTGTGIVIDNEGHILTNFHVIAGADQVTIVGEDARIRTAKVIGGFPADDVAILRVDDAEGLEPLPMGRADSMDVGDPVVAIGNALGLDSSSPTVTVGILSAVDRTIRTRTGQLTGLLQTDAAINPGNSGGPLLNQAGEVIGINTAIAGNAQNIGFAIPIETALPDVDRILEGLGKAFIGIGFVTNNSEYQQRFGLATNEGVIVTTVLPTGPADIAGLRVGDIIIAVDGQNVVDESSLEATIVAAEPGNVLELTVVRGRQQGMIDVTVGER
ncbi:putative serine protease HtrA [bacterium BMS3Abin02]|nr:putative serine protease HtrA [bacterium BMS3Abin02]HDL48940.1 PDZ domain-containing protein [Actinomycetota bacterium]